jgi:hypothetical protein
LKETGQNYAKSTGLAYFEVSAKENIGVDDSFRQIAKLLPSIGSEKKKNLQLEAKNV